VWAAVRWRKARQVRLITRIEAALEREQGIAIRTPDNPRISEAITNFALFFLLRAAMDFLALVAYHG
jgi:hypothetical protein